MAIVYLLTHLSGQYLREESEISHTINSVLIWNIKERCIAKRDTGYRPQLDVIDYEKGLSDEQKAKVSEALSNGLEGLKNSKLPMFTIEAALMDFLIRRSVVDKKMVKETSVTTEKSCLLETYAILSVRKINRFRNMLLR